MSNEKVEGLDQISVEVQKCLGEEGLKWLTEFFNVIFRTTKMPREWRFSTVIHLYKNKCDIKGCNNYKGIKLLSYTMELRKRMIVEGYLDIREPIYFYIWKVDHRGDLPSQNTLGNVQRYKGRYSHGIHRPKKSI